MSRLKFSNLEVDKNVAQLSNQVKTKSKRINVTNGPVGNKDIRPGEFVFSSIGVGQDGPSGPVNEEARIYFKDNNGQLFVFTGVKVG